MSLKVLSETIQNFEREIFHMRLYNSADVVHSLWHPRWRSSRAFALICRNKRRLWKRDCSYGKKRLSQCFSSLLLRDFFERSSTPFLFLICRSLFLRPRQILAKINNSKLYRLQVTARVIQHFAVCPWTPDLVQRSD